MLNAILDVFVFSPIAKSAPSRSLDDFVGLMKLGKMCSLLSKSFDKSDTAEGVEAKAICLPRVSVGALEGCSNVDTP